MSDDEGSPLEQPGSPEELEDLTTEANGDHPEESENDEPHAGRRKRSLSTSEEKNDDSPSTKVSKEEISLVIICDSYAKALEKIKQTETSIVFHLKVKVQEDLSLPTIPSAVEDLLSEDPETKCVVILLPQDDLRQTSIPHACKINSCSGKGLQHTLPLPVTTLTTYMDTLKSTREELIDTYPDTDFYWVTPGPVDFRYLNRKEIEVQHGHITTSDMWEVIIANYNKRLKAINEEIPGNMTINWFTRSCWQNRDNRGKRSDDSIQRVLQGDLTPIKGLGLIEKGEHLTVKGGQAMWMIIRKKIKWYRKSKAMEKAKCEKEEDPSDNTNDHKKGEVVNGKAEEDSHTENDLNESQKKKFGGSAVIKTTIIGDSWIEILSEIERWQPDPKNRMNVKAYPDLPLDSVIEKVDEVLSEETDTKHLVLSVFQSEISIGLSPEYVENECRLPCLYSTVEDLLEKASNIGKYIKKTYPQVKVFWVAPGPVGYYSEDNVEEKMEDDANQQKKEVKKEKETEDKSKDKETEESDEETEDKETEESDEESENKSKGEETEESDEESEEEKKETPKEKTVEEVKEIEEDPELRKLRRACSRCNTIAMILNKRLHFRYKKQVVDWFGLFNSSLHNQLKSGPGTVISYIPEYDGQILEGKLSKNSDLDKDFINLSELGGTRLMKLITTTISRENPQSSGSDDHGTTVSVEKNRSRGADDYGSSGNNRRIGGMRGRMDGGRGRGSARGRGGGIRRDSSMDRRPMDRRPMDRRPMDRRPMDRRPMDSRPMDNRPMDSRPMDNRLAWDGRGGSQHDPWGQQGGGNWKGQHRRFQSQDMRDLISQERTVSNRNDYWGGSSQYVDPWARNDYSGYYSQRY